MFEAQDKLRQSARSNLLANLELMRRQLEQLPESTSPVPPGLRTSVRTLLKAHRLIFDNSK
jgi:hypothetical protein